MYRGVDLVEGRYGDRWRQAVETTADEVVVYGGRPVEAVYTSMVGSRSRANQDVWPSDPVPYLQAVDSPEVGVAPYAQWSFSVTARQLLAILAAGGLDVGGELIDVIAEDPPEGEGRTELTIVSTAGVVADGEDFEGKFNFLCAVDRGLVDDVDALFGRNRSFFRHCYSLPCFFCGGTRP